MAIHVCKQCGLRFEYCRQCVFKPIRYKDLGFCSKACYEISNNPKIEEVIPAEDVEVVVMKEDASTPIEEVAERPYFFTEVEEKPITTIDTVKPKKKRAKPIKEIQKENDINDYIKNYGENIRTE